MSNHDWLGPPRHIPEDGAPHPDWDDLLADLINSGLTPDEIRARIRPIGAVLTYRVEGNRRPHGPLAGRADYAFVIHGDPDKADRWARDRIRSLMQSDHRLSAITVVTSEPGAYGPTLAVIHPEDTP